MERACDDKSHQAWSSLDRSDPRAIFIKVDAAAKDGHSFAVSSFDLAESNINV